MKAIEPIGLDELELAIGRREARTERLDIGSLRRYALALGSTPDVERAAPPLAHWAFFLPGPDDQALGEDGHPARSGFLPAIAMPRRMFAASDILFDAPLLLGEDAELVSTIADITRKTGRSGDLLFLQMDRLIVQAGQIRIRERQSYVYRAIGERLATPFPVDPPPAGLRWEPSSVNLFRFSAATFNGHRIHYDLPYAQDVEGYPALVVHGPFTAAKLAALSAGNGTLAHFSFRAQAPLFLGQPIYLQDHGNEVRALRSDGITAMIAKAKYR